MTDVNEDNRTTAATNNAINGGGGAADAATGRRQGGGGGGGAGGTESGGRRIAEDLAMDAEASVMANFDFLNEGSTGGVDDDDEMMAEDGLTDDLKMNNVSSTSATGGRLISTTLNTRTRSCFIFVLLKK